MNAAERNRFRVAQLNDKIDGGKGLIAMGLDRMGLDENDPVILAEQKAIAEMGAELKDIKARMAEQGIFMV